MQKGRKVWICQPNGQWAKGIVEIVKSKKTHVRTKNGVLRAVHKKVVGQKHNGKTFKHVAEKIPKARTGPRPLPFRPTVMQVKTCYFQGPSRIGEYRWMLSQPQFHRTLVIYNENLDQQRDKLNNFPGGGNACARPYRPQGRSIGMPTGEMGGWLSLQDRICNPIRTGETAKDAIHEAYTEIVDHIVANQGCFDEVYYCVDNPDLCSSVDKDLIGTGIFFVGHEVRKEITNLIKKIPKEVIKAAHAARA